MTMFYRDTDLAKRYSVDRTAIWRWCRNRAFPQPVKLSPGCSRWNLLDVEAWEESLSGRSE